MFSKQRGRFQNSDLSVSSGRRLRPFSLSILQNGASTCCAKLHWWPKRVSDFPVAVTPELVHERRVYLGARGDGTVEGGIHINPRRSRGEDASMMRHALHHFDFWFERTHELIDLS